MIEEIMINESL